MDTIKLANTTFEEFLTRLLDYFTEPERLIIRTNRNVYLVESILPVDIGVELGRLFPQRVGRGIKIALLCQNLSGKSLFYVMQDETGKWFNAGDKVLIKVLEFGRNLEVTALQTHDPGLISWLECLLAELGKSQEQPPIPAIQPEPSQFPKMPPIKDPLDQEILDLVTDDPDLTDEQIGDKVNLSRTAVNTRRRALQKAGYRVR